jgi:hypothetical protein
MQMHLTFLRALKLSSSSHKCKGAGAHWQQHLRSFAFIGGSNFLCHNTLP